MSDVGGRHLRCDARTPSSVRGWPPDTFKERRSMQTPVRLLAAACALAIAVSALPFAPTTSARAASDEPAGAQPPNALERGYRTGYSDGYQTGWRDQLARATRDFRAKDEYQRAD